MLNPIDILVPSNRYGLIAQNIQDIERIYQSFRASETDYNSLQYPKAVCGMNKAHQIREQEAEKVKKKNENKKKNFQQNNLWNTKHIYGTSNTTHVYIQLHTPYTPVNKLFHHKLIKKHGLCSVCSIHVRKRAKNCV